MKCLASTDGQAQSRGSRPTLYVSPSRRPEPVAGLHVAYISETSSDDTIKFLIRQCDVSPNTGRVSVGISAIVRITLRDGTVHEDVGYGEISNAPTKAGAFDKVRT